MDWLAGLYAPGMGNTEWTWLLSKIDGTEHDIYVSEFVKNNNANAKKIMYRIAHTQFETIND